MVNLEAAVRAAADARAVPLVDAGADLAPNRDGRARRSAALPTKRSV